jgi:putative flippase GtrA
MKANTAVVGANSCRQNEVGVTRLHVQEATSREAVEPQRVAAGRRRRSSMKIRPKPEIPLAAGATNPLALNDMPASTASAGASASRNVFGGNGLRGLKRRAPRENEAGTNKRRTRRARAVTLIRWGKFNLVGAIGILVQFAALFFLKGVLHLNYLAATALAVETAVVHNFVWHERYTWADRVRAGPAGLGQARSRFGKRSAALRWEKPCRPFGTRWQWRRAPGTHVPGYRMTPLRGCNPSVARFLRFNLSTGAVSIFGNLGMMRWMVGSLRVNYLLANGIAIVVCSLVNFVVSDGWVFGE